MLSNFEISGLETLGEMNYFTIILIKLCSAVSNVNRSFDLLEHMNLSMTQSLKHTLGKIS